MYATDDPYDALAAQHGGTAAPASGRPVSDPEAEAMLSPSATAAPKPVPQVFRFQRKPDQQPDYDALAAQHNGSTKPAPRASIGDTIDSAVQDRPGDDTAAHIVKGLGRAVWGGAKFAGQAITDPQQVAGDVVESHINEAQKAQDYYAKSKTVAQRPSTATSLMTMGAAPIIHRVFNTDESEARGNMHAMAAAVPALGPYVAGLTDTFTGDQEKGIEPNPAGAMAEAVGAHYVGKATEPIIKGTARGIAKIADVAPEATSKALEVARNNPITNTVIGPSPEAMAPADAAIKATKPRNSIKNARQLVQTALPDARRAADALNIDVNNMTLEDAQRAVSQGKKDVWTEFEQNHLGPNKHFGFDATPVADRIQAVGNRMTDIAQEDHPEIVSEIDRKGAQYAGRTMNLEQVEDRIQELNNQLRSQQATFKVNEMNLRNDPKFAHKFAELDGLRQLERDAFDQLNGSGDEVAGLKKRYGALKTMQDMIDRRVNVAERRNPVGVYEGMGRMAGAGKIARGTWATVMGHPGEGVPDIAQGAALLQKGKNLQLLNDPDFLIQQAFKNTEPRAPMAGPPSPPAIRGLLPSAPTELQPSSYEGERGTPSFYGEPGTREQRLGLLLPGDVLPPEPPVDTAAPGRTITRERVYEKADQPAGAGAGAAVYEPREPSKPVAGGSETTVRVPGEDRTYKAHYAVRELDDIAASHSGVSFQANPDYKLVNDRNYANAVNQGKIINNSSPARFDPAFHITDNPDATNGPIVIDSEGHALGGNGRAMILERVYRYNKSGADAYRKMLAEKAAQFGLDAEQVAKMKRPVLVREIDDAEFGAPTSTESGAARDTALFQQAREQLGPQASLSQVAQRAQQLKQEAAAGSKQAAITDFNKKGTAALTPAEQAISDSRRVSQKTLDDVAGRLDQQGADANLSDILNGAGGTEIIDKLISDGVISPQERAAYATKDALTTAGRERISKLIIGRFFRDPAQIDATLPAVRGKLERIAAPLAKVDGIQGWDLTPHLQGALDLLDDLRAHGLSSIDDLMKQRGLFGESTRYSPRAVTLARHLQTSSSKGLRDAVQRYAQDALDAQRPLLIGNQVTPEQAFAEAFAELPHKKAEGTMRISQ